MSFNYTEKFVPIVYSNLMSVSLKLESDIVQPVKHAASGIVFLKSDEELAVTGAKATTLQRILLDAQAPNVIDLLSLDVEGAEIEVLKGIDFQFFNFKYICTECRNIDIMNNFLTGHNYTFLEQLSEQDYLFSWNG